LRERKDVSLRHGIVFVSRHEHANAPHAVALLRALTAAAAAPPRSMMNSPTESFDHFVGATASQWRLLVPHTLHPSVSFPIPESAEELRFNLWKVNKKVESQWLSYGAVL
jgi:hypothetical protein